MRQTIESWGESIGSISTVPQRLEEAACGRSNPTALPLSIPLLPWWLLPHSTITPFKDHQKLRLGMGIQPPNNPGVQPRWSSVGFGRTSIRGRRRVGEMEWRFNWAVQQTLMEVAKTPLNGTGLKTGRGEDRSVVQI